MTNFILLLGLFALINKSHAACGDCSQISNAACIDETTYNLCLNGADKSGIIGTCSTGTVCTELPGICKPSSDNQPICPVRCDKCLGNDGKTPFACVSETEFVLCDPSKTPAEKSSVAYSCPPKTHCNIASYTLPTPGSICTEACSTEPTCSNAASIQNPAEKYTSSCTGTITPGLYPDKSDTTCKTYVYCENLNSQMYSIQYTCNTGYFDKDQKACVANKPSYCT